MPTHHLFTSESVSEGHPDKVADRVSDEILDGYLRESPQAHVAIETLVTTDRCIVAGEVRGPEVNLEALARKAIRDIGYASPGFSWETLRFESHVHAQSAEIAQGVDAREGGEEGAGDQGLMFGRSHGRCLRWHRSEEVAREPPPRAHSGCEGRASASPLRARFLRAPSGTG